MSYKIKSSLYFASFAIAAFTYYTVGQTNVQERGMEKEIGKIENQTAATPSTAIFSNLP